MKHITVAVPDEVYREAMIRAEGQGLSVNAMVAEYLRSLSQQDAEFTSLEVMQKQVQAEIVRFRAADRIGRHEAHRRVAR